MSGFLDMFKQVSGRVSPYIVGPGGRIEQLAKTHNDVLYTGNQILSNLMSGAVQYAPSHIIFVCGSDDSALPAFDSSTTYSGLVGDRPVFIAPILSKTVKPGSQTSEVVFSSHTGVATAEGTFGAAVYVGRVILACCLDSTSGLYTPFSAANFVQTYQIPTNANFGVYWSVTFGAVAATQES